MAVCRESRRPLPGGRGSAVVRVDDDAIRRTSAQEQADARDFARRLAQEIAARLEP